MNTFSLAPLLFSISRGSSKDNRPITECVHRGFIAVIDGKKQSIMTVGDSVKTHMRSTAKPFQIVPLLESSYLSSLSDQDIALCMSSHCGQELHTQQAHDLLLRFGFDKSDLRCGAHAPQSVEARFQLWQKGQQPSVLHNNCSGKHTAMLLCCQHYGFSKDHYEHRDHPLQQRIKAIIAHFADEDIAALDEGVDGCSMPSFSFSLSSIAYAYARLASWPQGPYEKITERLWHAATNNPEFVAGPRRFDTELMRLAQGALLSKTGADGMHALAIKPCKQFPHGLGIAIKITDGDASQKIRPAIVKEVLSRLNLWPWGDALDGLLPSTVNHKGVTTSSMTYHF